MGEVDVDDTAVRPSAETDGAMAPGTRVEVRRRFDLKWARGFEVAEVVKDGYRILRRSDGTVLPVAFSAEEVRAERKRQGMWWY